MTLYRTPGRSRTRPPRTSTIECSCKLCPIPGMYVVTSTVFVKRTRATLRKAEFGFFGVWVYTRMHTPRFSGQPASAGDLVLTKTFSRPIRTSCENVGTVVPLCDRTAVEFRCDRSQRPTKLRAKFPVALARRAYKNAREHTSVLKGLLRIRRYNQQETPYALQEAELFSWLQFGEAYSALRDRRPIPAALQSHSVLLCSGIEDNSLPTHSTAERSPSSG